MLLKIRNMGKVDAADVEINGITVIAGPNNTGKSTVGKTLFCLFNALSDIDLKILTEKRRQIVREIHDFLAVCDIVPDVSARDVFGTDEVSPLPPKADLFRRVRQIISEKTAACGSLPLRPGEDERLFSGIADIFDIPDGDIRKVILTRYFSMEFNGQINHVDRNAEATAELGIGGRALKVRFSGDRCVNIDGRINIFSRAVYLDTPLIIGAARTDAAFPGYGMTMHHADAASLLHQRLSRPLEGVLDEAINRKKLAAVLSKINEAIPGEFVIDPKLGDAFREEGAEKPVSLPNLSSGLKVLAIIRKLAENGTLTSKCLLILDEPEIHLHPEWQLVFAEIIVLLRKEMGLNILFNTHSPYFLNAIEVFSMKHGIDSVCRYYVSENTSQGHAVITDVGGNIERIYRELAIPFQKLEDLRYEDTGWEGGGLPDGEDAGDRV